MEFYTLSLPRSGLLVQWREDDMQRVAAAAMIDDEDWSPVSVLYTTDPESFPHELKQQAWPGDNPGPTWWLIIGALNRAAAVEAQLADGAFLPVHRLGPLLLCEWESTPQMLTLTIDSISHKLMPFRSPSRGPAPYPYPRPDNYRGPDGNWVGFSRPD
jgi:hypothetical protein